jgi:hypothetical protein
MEDCDFNCIEDSNYHSKAEIVGSDCNSSSDSNEDPDNLGDPKGLIKIEPPRDPDPEISFKEDYFRRL